MRKAVIAIVIMLATMQLYAASWHMGIEAGYTLGLYDQRGGVREHETISNGHAFEVAIPVECRFGDIFSLSTALRYVGKAYDVENIFIDELTYRYRDVEHFLELPLSLRLSLDLEPVRMFIGAGAYIGVRFMSTEAGRFNLNLQESPPSKQSERWRGMEEETSGMIRLQHEEMSG